MPSPATAKLLPPQSSDEFEEICVDALRLHWGDRNAVRHGRNGQAQHGVDIYSPAMQLAAQCKNKLTLSSAEAEAELRRISGFHLPLKSLTFMLAGPRDAPTQGMIDGLSQQSQQSGGCVVCVLFWEDIVGLIARSPALVHKHWPAFFVAHHGHSTESIVEWRQRVFGQHDAMFGEYREPDWWVERNYPKHGQVRAWDFMSVRVYSPALARQDFEPDDEDQFAELIAEVWSTELPTVVATHGGEVIVEQGGPDAALHRRWGWSCRGCLGFVTTLKDACEPSRFPVADLSWDIEDLFRLVGEMLQEGEVLLVLELKVYDLMPSWRPSDRRVTTPIRGLRGEASRPPEWRRSFQQRYGLNAEAMRGTPGVHAATLMATALKDLFKVRLSRKEFAESLSELRSQVRRDPSAIGGGSAT